MSSCQVCYEAYADEGEHVPYKLKCGDIQCFRCIESELIDGEYYCPECGDAYRGESVTDFAIALMTTDLGLKYTSDEGTSDEEHSSRNSRSNSADSSPRCASNHSSMDRRLSVRTPCKAPDCDKKAISNGYCLKHTKHLSRSVLGLEQLANEMIEHHDLRNFKNSSHNLRKSEQEPSRTSIILDPPALIEKFQAQERIELGEALDLIMRAKAVMSREPNILRLDAPVIVVGDVHGQFFDLVNIMNEAARSTGKSLADQQLGGPMYLFLGDYVDRGQYSCEVMLYLLSLKVAYPERIWLVRGNHECASVSGHFGFKEECKVKYGMNIYYSFLLMFQTMPLGAIISTAFGDIYACHGGLSPGLETIETIETLDRMIEPESNPNLMDILWADPISDENVENMTPDEYNEFINIDWRPNPSRGCSYCYGYRTVKRFLETNNLVCLVRAHEVQEEGYRKHFAPEIMESKIITLQQKMSRAALAKEVAAKARLSLHLHAQKNAAYHVFNTTNNVGSADSELGGLHIDVEEDFNPEEALRVLHGATADHENAYEFSEITTPSASGVRNRGFHHATSASDVLHHNIVHNSTTHNTTHNSSMQSMHSVHSKRSSPYRPASDTSSSAGIQQAEDFPPVITIFSAPNYCDRYHNKGAILLIDSALDGFRVIQYDCAEHPPTEVRESQTKTLIDLVIATCPYMPTSFRNFVRLAVELGQDDVDSVYSGSSSVDGSVVEYTEDNNTEDDLEDDLDNMDIIEDNTDINNAIRNGEDAYEAICEVDGSVIEHTSGSRPASPRGSPVDKTLALLLPTDSTGAFITATDASVATDPSAVPDGNNMEMTSSHKMTRRASKIISLVRQNSLTMSFPSVSSHEGTSERLPSPFPYVTEEESVPHNSEPTSARSIKEDREEDELVHCFSENEDLDIHTQHAHMFSLSPILTTDLEPYISNTFLHSNTKENENTMNTESSKLPRRKSNVYIQALASDAINEAHPVKLNLYLEEFKKTYESSLKKGFQISLFELSSDEKPAISVNDLKKRFENKSFDSFTTNTRPFSQNKEVVHDFERGTGISSIMNMFGGSGRISSSGKFRTSFPLDTCNSTEDLPVQRELRRRSEGGGGGKEAEHVVAHSQHKVHNHRHSTGSAHFNLDSLDNDHIITNEAHIGNSVVLNGDSNNGAEYKSGFHSEGHTPTKPPLNRSIRDVNQRYSLSSTASDNTSTTGNNNNNNTNPNNNNDNGNHHRITSTGSTLSNASLTSDVQHNLDTLDTLSTAATAGAGSMLERTQSDSVLFTQSEIMGLRLMFSLFDRSGENKISYLDLVAYAEETDDGMAIRDAGSALEILDLDGDGCIGILDFIYFARRLKKMHQLAEREENGTNMP